MFALTLAVGLYGLDAEVRQSEAFALAGELGRFPPPAVVANNRRIAKEHLERLEAIRVMGPLAGDVPDWYLESSSSSFARTRTSKTRVVT
jgi:hypothetical protein